MTLLIFLIILVLSLFVSNGSILGTTGDYEIYKNLLFDVNSFNINWDDINYVGGDLWQETRRYGLIWILIMKIHTIIFGDNYQLFLFNLSFITLSVKYLFLKILHKLKYQTFFAFIFYISTLFVLQEALRIRASLSVCFAIAGIYFLSKSNYFKNIKKLFYLFFSILFIVISLNININGFYLASIFLIDFFFTKNYSLFRISNLKFLKNNFLISFFLLISSFIFSSFIVDNILSDKGIIGIIFPYLTSDSKYFSALFIIPVLFTVIIHNLLVSSNARPFKISNVTPLYISFIIGMVIKSQYLLYEVLNMSFFYFLSFKENLSTKYLLSIFLFLSSYYLLIRTLPLVFIN